MTYATVHVVIMNLPRPFDFVVPVVSYTIYNSPVLLEDIYDGDIHLLVIYIWQPTDIHYLVFIRYIYHRPSPCSCRTLIGSIFEPTPVRHRFMIATRPTRGRHLPNVDIAITHIPLEAF